MSSVKIVSASSDEPEDAKGNGDGATLNDIVILSGTSLKVRAERADTGNGRVYHMNLSVTDNCGATATATATVLVPNNGSTIDDCPNGGCPFTVAQTGTCP